jgi:hypothetical protein
MLHRLMRNLNIISAPMERKVGVVSREIQPPTSTIVKLIEPIFVDLSKPELLRKCTHGLTQNVNECLNGLIWNRCPKTIYVEQETVALATYLAVLKFNDGDISFLKIFQDLDITPGVFTGKGTQDCDKPNQTVGQKVQREGENKKKNIETPQKELHSLN